MHKVVIALGTNIGDKEQNIERALLLIEARGIKILKKSSVIKTEPYGYTEQPEFLNCVVLAETELTPNKLLETLLSIEKEMGRVRKIHWGPRIIDLDIIFYDNLAINEENLKIPHPDMQNREFVLKPLNEIAPCYVHPVLCKTVRTLYEELENKKH